MGPGRGLGLVLGLLLGTLGGAASERHSLSYSETGVSEPSPGVPRYASAVYLDGNLVARYDSDTGRVVPRVGWMDQQYWEEQTTLQQRTQKVNGGSLDILQRRFNQSGTAHTLQLMLGCDLLEDGSTTGHYWQVAYDGRELVAFDKDTKALAVADWALPITKKKEDKEGVKVQGVRNDLENVCVETLKKFVSYGRAALERKEPPTVRVSGREDADGTLTLSCRAYGFYPRRIAVSWLRDGDNWDHETWRGSVAPNSDGTFYTWASIEARPQEKDKYRCRVEHAGLPEPGLFAWEPESNPLGIVLGVVVAVLFVTVVAGVVWKLQKGKKKEKGYEPTGNSN